MNAEQATQLPGKWFRASSKPYRRGVYPVRFQHSNKVYWCYWTGSLWCDTYTSPEAAAHCVAHPVFLHQDLIWYGFAK
jgi:hypothetical protein